MASRFDGSAAVLSVLYPGWGQLAQHRRVLGWVQFWWATALLVAFYLAPALGFSRILPGVELIALTVWSGLDAAFRRPNRTLGAA
ncbi:MAG: hypothetical protein ACT4R6_05880 [Gemmatimonadaceae bacterium]